MKIILINGKARSGKDTLASLIKGRLKDKKVLIRANAQSVKDCARKYFNWNGDKDDKGRQLLINITNIGYNADPYLWERKTLEYALAKDVYDYLIITDWRYISTYDYFKQQDYEVITILRQRDIDNGLSDNLKNDISEQRFDMTYDLEIRGDIVNNNLMIEYLIAKIEGRDCEAL